MRSHCAGWAGDAHRQRVPPEGNRQGRPCQSLHSPAIVMARSAYAGCDPWRPDRQGCPPQESQPLLSQNGAQPNTYDRKQMFPLVLPTCIYQASPWHQIIGATASEPLPVACNSMQVRTAGLRRTSGTTVWPSPVAAPGTHRESSSGSFEEVVCSLKLMFWCEAWEILADKRAVRPCLGLLGRRANSMPSLQVRHGGRSLHSLVV